MDILKNALIIAGFSVLVPACVDPNIDTDGDGMIDSWEQRHGLDINDPSDAALDNDGDGLTNRQEFSYRSNPNSTDSDGDTLPDGEEVANGTHPARADTDRDGLNDNVEIGLGTNPVVSDTDGDGLNDGDEINLGADPFDTDSDDDTISDGDEVHIYGSSPIDTDSDDDGLSDEAEVNIHRTSPASADTDGDTLLDPEELDGVVMPDGVARAGLEGVVFKTNPRAADTDGDGVSDGEEINKYGTDPLDYADKPPNAPVTWMYESFERAEVPEGFVTPATAAASLGWEVVANESASGRYSLKSKDIGSGGSSEVEYTATFVAGALYFDYRIELGHGRFRVYLDGYRLYVPDRDDTLIWQTLRVNLTKGQHTIKWVFQNNGEGAAWIDNVRFKIGYGDYDHDTMPDLWETKYALNRLNPDNVGLDADLDGLTNLEEFQAGTDPQRSDTDGDGLSDFVEIRTYFTNPLLMDTDGDGLSDSVELDAADPTDPLSGDSDGDNFSDGFESEQGNNPNDETDKPGFEEYFSVSFPDGNTEDWGAFNRRAGWVRLIPSADQPYTIAAAPLGGSQIIEWKRYFVNGTLNFSYAAVKQFGLFKYSIDIYLDGAWVGGINPGTTKKFEVSWSYGNKSINIPAGNHTIRWKVTIPDPVKRYELGLYIGGISFRGVALPPPTP